jgi:hypothetical protein
LPSRFVRAAATAKERVRAATLSPDAAFWVSSWAQPKVILNGPEEEAFYQNLKEVLFARNEYDKCLNPSALDDDARLADTAPKCLRLH